MYNKYKKYILFKFYINNYIKMSHIVKYIIEINSLNYNKQCKYIKNKLLSLKSCDISGIIFLKSYK